MEPSMKTAKSKTAGARFRNVLGLIRKSRGMTVGLVIVASYLVVGLVVYASGLLGFRITPYNPIENFVATPLSGPSWAHLFVSDSLGRDVFSRIIAATPTDMGVSLSVITVAFFVGGT